MADDLAEKFIHALDELETNRNVDEIASLFSDDCEIGNTALTKSLRGREGAREFWTNYRRTFRDVHSDFKSKVFADGTAALEWVTTGTAENGREIRYEGVSVLESDASKINRFFAYFDPGKLGSQISEGHHVREI